MITQQELKELFDYRDGCLYWRVTRIWHRPAGSKAGTKNSNGYMDVGLNGKLYKLHRLVFLWHHGWLPKYLDHINGDKLDNRIENLRPVNGRQNNANRGVHGNNKTGYRGVCFHKLTGKWQATLCGRYLGLFDTAQEASEEYEKQAAEMFGEYRRK